jgi:ADP-ribose pyrophosphatase YjhB (NUDIX family)
LRELEEEVGLIPHDMEKRGVVTFVHNDDQTAMEAHIFSVTSFF